MKLKSFALALILFAGAGVVAVLLILQERIDQAARETALAEYAERHPYPPRDYELIAQPEASAVTDSIPLPSGDTVYVVSRSSGIEIVVRSPDGSEKVLFSRTAAGGRVRAYPGWATYDAGANRILALVAEFDEAPRDAASQNMMSPGSLAPGGVHPRRRMADEARMLYGMTVNPTGRSLIVAYDLSSQRTYDVVDLSSQGCVVTIPSRRGGLAIWDNTLYVMDSGGGRLQGFVQRKRGRQMRHTQDRRPGGDTSFRVRPRLPRDSLPSRGRGRFC